LPNPKTWSSKSR